MDVMKYEIWVLSDVDFNKFPVLHIPVEYIWNKRMRYYTYNVKRGRTTFVDSNKPSMIRTIKYFIPRIKPKIQLPLAKVNINKYTGNIRWRSH